MKQRWIFIVASSLALVCDAQSEATLIKIVPPESIINTRQSLEIVIIDANGNAFKQPAYYNPLAGGLEMDAKWAGPNASIYIPNWKTGYIWHNGHWIDEAGYYWDGSRKTASEIPDWRNQWVDYWHKYWHDRRGYWPRGSHDRADERKRYGRSHEKRQLEDAGMKGFGQANSMPSTRMENTPIVPDKH